MFDEIIFFLIFFLSLFKRVFFFYFCSSSTKSSFSLLICIKFGNNHYIFYNFAVFFITVISNFWIASVARYICETKTPSHLFVYHFSCLRQRSSIKFFSIKFKLLVTNYTFSQQYYIYFCIYTRRFESYGDIEIFKFHRRGI